MKRVIFLVLVLAIAALAQAPPLQIVTTSLPDASVGLPYSATIIATGGVAPYTVTLTHWSMANPPKYLHDGKITGTPSTAMQTSFTITVTDSSTPPQHASRDFTVTIHGSNAHHGGGSH